MPGIKWFRTRYEPSSARLAGALLLVGLHAPAAANFGFAPSSGPVLDGWLGFWRERHALAPAEDPAKAVPFSLAPAAAAPAVADLGKGTGFFVSEDGFLLTAYHAARTLCPVPEDGGLRLSVPCRKGWTLRAAPSWLQYADGADYALLSRPVGVLEPIRLRGEAPRRLERVFLAGYPERHYSRRAFGAGKARAPYPVENAGRRPRWAWWEADPLVFSTGRITSIREEKSSLSRRAALATGPGYLSEESRLEVAAWDGDPNVPQALVPVSPGSSGGPLLDASGRAVAVCAGRDRYLWIGDAARELGLCRAQPGEGEEWARLRRVFSDAGLCPVSERRPRPASGG